MDLEPFEVGCRMLGMEPTPAQILQAKVILSKLARRIAISIPRRAGKTTAIEAVLIGLCATRPGFVVAAAWQSGIKGRDRFEELVERLTRYDADGDWHSRHAAGAQRIIFGNGAKFLLRVPKGDAYRGDAADVTWFDESQEHDVPTSRELLGAVLPTMDTAPDALLIISGTPGVAPEGLLWDALERLRGGTGGGVEFAAPEDADPGDPAVWWATHPGLSGGLTTLEVIAERYVDMDAEQFAREYLGIWPRTASNALIDPEVFAELAVDAATPPADGTAVIAWDCAPDGSSASVFVAWKSSMDDDIVTTTPVRTDGGTLWVAAEVDALVRSLKGKAVYDPIGPNVDIAAMLTRLRTPRVTPLRGLDLKGGYSSIIERVSTGRLRHVPSDDLDLAIAEAERRPYGESWLWRRTPHSAALVAVTHAAWVAGATKARTRTRLRSTGAA